MGLKSKICLKCKKSKPINQFYSDKYTIDRLRGRCKSCGKKYQQSEQGKISIKKYYYKNRIKLRKYLKKYGQTINGIYHCLCHSAKDRNIIFNINLNDFSIWYENQSKKCIYCNRLESVIIKDHNKKYKRLTIDRKDNNKGYLINNLVLCCYKCNTVKGSDLTFEEMLEVGKILSKIYSKYEK